MQLPQYFPDLREERGTSAFAMVAHHGEIDASRTVATRRAQRHGRSHVDPQRITARGDRQCEVAIQRFAVRRPELRAIPAAVERPGALPPSVV